MDPELTAEQAYVDDAYRCLDWMRERATDLLGGTDPKEIDLVHALRRRVRALTDGGRPLCFGRIDLETTVETEAVGLSYNAPLPKGGVVLGNTVTITVTLELALADED